MKLFGITGLMGSGKSLALRLLKEQGYPVVDADQVSREVVDPALPEGRRGLALVAQSFGPTVLDSEGRLDRGFLRSRIAQNNADRLKLESILHPLILEKIRERVATWNEQGHRIGFIEGTRLVESGFMRELEALIVVTAPESLRLERLRVRDGRSVAEIQAIFAVQDEQEWMKLAGEVWTNSGDRDALRRQISDFVQRALEAP